MLLSENIESDGDTFPFSFEINHDVLEELIFSAEYDERDTFALLLGDKSEKNIRLNGFCALQIAKFSTAFFTVKASLTDRLVAQTQKQIKNNEEIQPEHPSAGWFISQPGGDAKLNNDMMRVHFSLFNLPHLPILVFDPISQKIALYAREKYQFKNVPFAVRGRANSAVNKDA